MPVIAIRNMEAQEVVEPHGGSDEEGGEATTTITDVRTERGRCGFGFVAQISILSRVQNWTGIFAKKTSWSMSPWHAHYHCALNDVVFMSKVHRF